MANDYSRRWFRAFLDTVPEEWTANEVAGITQRIPLPAFRRVLDICCGTGRHAERLVDAGYEVVGIDRDADAIAAATQRVREATFQVLDVRDIADVEGTFDAAMILWQSFGYFDAATNDRILGDTAERLRPGGRLLLDLYNPAYVRAHTGTQTVTRARECRSIENAIRDGRLISTITYVDGSVDTMDFELFEPAELSTRARRCGLTTVEVCTWWDASRPVTATEPRYQMVLQRDR